jgi:hypothetical protein
VVNEKVRNYQQKNEELTAEEEAQKSHITNLESLQQEVTNDNDFLKNKILHQQQATYEAGKRKQVRSVYFLLGSNLLVPGKKYTLLTFTFLPFKEVNSGMCANLVGVCQRDNENLC